MAKAHAIGLAIAVRAALTAMVLLLLACAPSEEDPNRPDWRSDWALADNLALTIDSQGYHFPTALAFVPHPGPGPQDPLYFVTELGGSIRVVTNDRSVHTFFEGLVQPPAAGDVLAEGGVAGICLEPQHGYVYVTFAAPDGTGNAENRIVRFQTDPITFSLRPTSWTNLTHLFSDYKLGLNGHQIGGCQINDDLVYVSVGDGMLPYSSRQIRSPLGKVLRMTLDGKPVADNPFYEDADPDDPANYVWALGFRNPFGLKTVDGRLYVADNGNDIDRFLEIHSGEDYDWDGTDWSIGLNSAAIFAPSIAPVQMDYLPADASQFPKDLAGRFFLAASAGDKGKRSGIVTLNYSSVDHKMVDVPRYLLRYHGNGFQSVVGLAFGPDGLYFAPLMPDVQGQSGIFRITYDPSHAHPIKLDDDDPAALFEAKGCYGCHRLEGLGGSNGPSFDREDMLSDLEARLHSKAFKDSLQELDRSEQEPFVTFRSARHEILSLQGLDQIRAWMAYRIQEPRFDNPDSRMPNLGLSKADAQLLADYLVTRANTRSANAAQTLTRSISMLPSKGLILFLGGLFVGAVGLGLSERLLHRLKQARRKVL